MFVTLSLLVIVCDDIKHLSFSNIQVLCLHYLEWYCGVFMFRLFHKSGELGQLLPKAKTSENKILLDKITTCTFSTWPNLKDGLFWVFTTPNSGRFVTLNDCSDENEDWASHLFQALTLIVYATYYIAFRI